MKSKILGLLAVALLAGPMAVRAEIIFSNLGAGDSFQSDFTGGRNVAGASSPTGSVNTPAYSFVASVGGSLSEIGLGLHWVSGTNSVVVSLYTVVPWSVYTGPAFGTIQPGTLLGSWTLANIRSTTGATTGLATVTGISGVNLTAGATYFLTLSPSASDTYVVWNNNSTGATATLWQCNGVTTSNCPQGFISYANVTSGAMLLRSADPVQDVGVLLQQLHDKTTGVGTGTSLADKVAIVQAYLAVPDIQSACIMLDDFKNQVSAQRGKKITPALADQLTADANAIIAAIGCN